MIEVICNDRLGKKIRVKCNPGTSVLCCTCTCETCVMLRLCPKSSPSSTPAAVGCSLPPAHQRKFPPAHADDTVGDLKKLLAAQTGTRPEKLRIQKWYTIYKDHITLEDYEIHDGMGLELYYN